MLKIRLQRKGKKKQAFFRIVVQEHTEKLQGKYLELLGNYDPHSKELNVDKDRVEYWVSKGAQVSPTLNNIMVNQKVWDKEKMHSWTPKKKEKTEEAAPVAAPKAATPEADKAADEADKTAEKPPEAPVQDASAEDKKEEETTTEAAPAAA